MSLLLNLKKNLLIEHAQNVWKRWKKQNAEAVEWEIMMKFLIEYFWEAVLEIGVQLLMLYGLRPQLI